MENLSWTLAALMGRDTHAPSREMMEWRARQMEFLKLMRRMETSTICQVVMATHSPVLMAYPGARLLRLTKYARHRRAEILTKYYSTRGTVTVKAQLGLFRVVERVYRSGLALRAAADKPSLG
jgi:predicted ATPase